MYTKGIVQYNGTDAGVLEKTTTGYTFMYLPEYLAMVNARPVSVTLPLQRDTFMNNILFPFFANLLSEGVNKELQCRKWKIDGRDYFTLLLNTTQEETIGAVTVKPYFIHVT